MQTGYLELKLSWELFQKAPEKLSVADSAHLDKIAARQQRIEQQILASPEAAHVHVPAHTLATRMAEIRARYPDEADFIEDMARTGLSEDELKKAIERDLRMEALLEKVAAAVQPASSVDAEIYYRLHPEAFTPPESRRLRHILLTFNNPAEKAKATQQLELLRSTLENAEKFGKAALRYSQCPTAMDGGQLGNVKHQQLFPALEAAAFALEEGRISEVLESPIGLHLLRCDEIHPAIAQPFAAVEAKIIERLTDKRREQAQRQWIRAQTYLPPQG